MLTIKPQPERTIPEVTGLVIFVVVIYCVWCALSPLLHKLSQVVQ